MHGNTKIKFVLLKLKGNEKFYYLWNNAEKFSVVYFKVLLWIESESTKDRNKRKTSMYGFSTLIQTWCLLSTNYSFRPLEYLLLQADFLLLWSVPHKKKPPWP